MTLFGTSAKFIDAVPRRASCRATRIRLSARPNDHVDRIAARARELRLRLSRDQDGRAPRLDLRRHRHRQLLRRRQSRTAPVWRGEIQAPGLGMDVDVFDEDGQASDRRAPASSSANRRSRRCRWASGTIPDGTKYHDAYFDRFPGVWCHGDWISRTEHGGFVIYGRSDATLNPGGVRIGTAEIYRQVEQLPEVLESLAVGQRGTATSASSCSSGSRPA